VTENRKNYRRSALIILFHCNNHDVPILAPLAAPLGHPYSICKGPTD
jgi:hypothetical protein